jgi:hypothetical protein
MNLNLNILIISIRSLSQSLLTKRLYNLKDLPLEIIIIIFEKIGALNGQRKTILCISKYYYNFFINKFNIHYSLANLLGIQNITPKNEFINFLNDLSECAILFIDSSILPKYRKDLRYAINDLTIFIKVDNDITNYGGRLYVPNVKLYKYLTIKNLFSTFHFVCGNAESNINWESLELKLKIVISKNMFNITSFNDYLCYNSGIIIEKRLKL